MGRRLPYPGGETSVTSHSFELQSHLIVRLLTNNSVSEAIRSASRAARREFTLHLHLHLLLLLLRLQLHLVIEFATLVSSCSGELHTLYLGPFGRVNTILIEAAPF